LFVNIYVCLAMCAFPSWPFLPLILQIHPISTFTNLSLS
jgi:hypothetical protein